MRQRAYLRHRTERRLRYEQHLARNNPSRFDNVRWSQGEDLWVVYSLPPTPHEKAQKLVGFQDRAAAEAMAYTMALNVQDMTDHNGRQRVPLLDPETANRRAGFQGPDLGVLHQALFYQPHRGALCWREGNRRGADATTPTRGKSLRVTFQGYKLPAHAVAWFLSTGIWPSPGELRPLNGDYHDLRLDNLDFRMRGSVPK